MTTATTTAVASWLTQIAAPFPICLYCGSSHLIRHWSGIKDRLGYVAGERAFLRCKNCDSLRLDPFPEPEEIAGFYPPVYSFSLDAGQKSRLRQMLTWLEYVCFYRPQYQAQARKVLRGIGWRGEKGLRLLDVGCGRGLRLSAFQKRGFQVHGLDLQPEVVDYVRHELGIAATVGGIEAIDDQFEPQSFDLITAFYLLEHVPSVQDVLSRCFRALRPGGWFVGVVPICDGWQASLFGPHWIHVTEAPRHLSLPSRAGLLRSAERAGYTCIHLCSDSLLNSAGIVGGSLLPGSDLTAVYGGAGKWLALAKRVLGGGVALASIPFVAAENYLGRTSHGMLFAQRPAE